jgi:hypothetical protein
VNSGECLNKTVINETAYRSSRAQLTFITVDVVEYMYQESHLFGICSHLIHPDRREKSLRYIRATMEQSIFSIVHNKLVYDWIYQYCDYPSVYIYYVVDYI